MTHNHSYTYLLGTSHNVNMGIVETFPCTPQIGNITYHHITPYIIPHNTTTVPPQISNNITYYGIVPPPQSFSYESMSPPCYPTQPPSTTSSAPCPPPTNSKTNKQGSVVPLKWTIEEDLHLVKSWINVSMNPIIGTNQKLASFWTKVAYTFT